MSSTSTTLPSTHETATSTRWRDWWELGKPRLSLMAVFSAGLGYLAAEPQVDLGVLTFLLLGTSMASFGAAGLNQWWEQESDARMARTRDRPVASGRLSSELAFFYGLTLSIAGTAMVELGAGWLAGILTGLTVLLYVALYTPLKKRTPWATEIGAVPGALPPLIGWVAADGGLGGTLGWLLFAFLFAWQIPHFMAISWLYREDYRRGGFRMTAVLDEQGGRVARKALAWTLLLLVVSFLPLLTGDASWLLGLAAAALALFLLRAALRFLRPQGRALAARQLFLATIIYLPLYLAAITVDRFLLN